jgi:hypothetical protein
MGPSEKAFQQVRNILGKLDRNIDQLRTTRTAPEEPAPSHAQAATTKVPDRIGAERTVPGVNAGANPTPPRASSAYGRATPIPPSGH